MDAFYIGGEIEISPPVLAQQLASTRYSADGRDDSDSEVVVIADDGGDHSSLVPVSGDRETSRPESIVADVQALVDLLGPDYTFSGALRIDDPTGQPPSRVRVVHDGAHWRAVQEEAEYVYAADYTVPPGPAVIFDADAAHNWLAERVDGGLSRGQADYNIDTDGVYDPTEHSPADWLERLLNRLVGDQPAAPQVWHTAPGVLVEVVETVGVEAYADGGAVLVVEVGGLRAASHWLTGKDLADAQYHGGTPARPQLDAAVEALGVAARTVNQLVERHRAVRAAEAATRATLCTIPSLAGQLSLADVECALRTLADLWNGDDPFDVLSTRQRKVADWVTALVAAEHADNPDGSAAEQDPHEVGDCCDMP